MASVFDRESVLAQQKTGPANSVYRWPGFVIDRSAGAACLAQLLVAGFAANAAAHHLAAFRATSSAAGFVQFCSRALNHGHT